VRNIKPEGKGNYRVMNQITPKGKQLSKDGLKQLTVVIASITMPD
jgi:hypothetical protein